MTTEGNQPAKWHGVCQFRLHAAMVHETRAGGRTFTVCDDCERLLLAGRKGADRPARCKIIYKDSNGDKRSD